MIHSFSCKNFYSFKDLTVVDFIVNNEAPNNHGYFTTKSKTRLSKVETVIGPNASGKTNLLKVLPFLKWLIIDSFSLPPKLQLPIKPFLLGSSSKKKSELSVVFEVNGNIYTYSFTLDATKIFFEELKIKNQSQKRITNKKLFSRTWNENTKQYDLDDKGFNLPREFKELLRLNASIVSTAVQLNHKESQELISFWKKIETNVVEAGWAGDRLLSTSNVQLISALDFYSEYNNKKIKQKAEELLSQFDLGLKSFKINKEQKEDRFSISVKVTHQFNDQKQYLPIQYESSGTKQLFILLKTILLVLANGGVAVLDEFDVNLHPEIVTALFDLFIQPETNLHNAQLLFSTHSHLILNRLDKYQIILTEKNEQGGSEVWRLDEMTGVRADDNYYAKYLANTYGAIPKL